MSGLSAFKRLQGCQLAERDTSHNLTRERRLRMPSKWVIGNDNLIRPYYTANWRDEGNAKLMSQDQDFRRATQQVYKEETRPAMDEKQRLMH